MIEIWRLWHSFDKIVLSPGESVRVHLELENLLPEWIYVGAANIAIPWFTEPWTDESRTQISPGVRRTILTFDLPVPESVVGQIDLAVGLDTWIWSAPSQQWLALGEIIAQGKLSLWSVPTPRYRAFVSRGLGEADRPIGDQIVSMIQLWGFETHTVGYNVFEPDPAKVPQRIKEEIVKSDCLVAIATPRDVSGIDWLLRTFTWLHGETGMAFVSDKPILVFCQAGISLEGLIGSEVILKVWFSPLDVFDLYYRLASVMPSFRRWIAEAKKEEFVQALLDFAGKVGLGLLIGYALKLPER